MAEGWSGESLEEAYPTQSGGQGRVMMRREMTESRENLLRTRRVAAQEPRECVYKKRGRKIRSDSADVKQNWT